MQQFPVSNRGRGAFSPAFPSDQQVSPPQPPPPLPTEERKRRGHKERKCLGGLVVGVKGCFNFTTESFPLQF